MTSMTFEDGEGRTRPVYSEVMEDYDVLADALALARGEVAVAVASAGDNVFNAALAEPRELHGVDVSAAQTALCRLKTAAIGALSWRELAELVGVLDATPERRAELFGRLPNELTSAVLQGAEVRAITLAHGLAACGELAAFVAPLREGLAARVGKENLRAILTTPDAARRRELWTRHFATDDVEDFLALALNEDTISGAFLPRAAFEQPTDVPFHRFYFGVLRHLLVELDPTRNHFAHRLWLGAYPSPEAVSPYLRAENHERLRELAPSIEWHTQDLSSFLASRPARSVDVFNLSNVCDWLPDDADDAYGALWGEVDRTAAPGARAFLRSFLTERALPRTVAGAWHTEPARNRALTQADRVGYFARCEVWTRGERASG